MKWKYLLIATLPFFISSCKKQAQAPIKEPVISAEANLATPALSKFNNVVILGNSITYSGPYAPLGWYGDWGMAASAQDSDYVHVLKRSLQLRNPDVQVQVKNIQEFELGFATYDFDAQLKSLKDTNPDLVILRIGENLQAGIDLNVFEQRYKDLINYFKAGNPNVIVVGVSTVFVGMADPIMAKYPPYVSLAAIHNDSRNFALGLFENYAVQTHPGNTGMKNIASLIWLKVKTLN
ncbi:SGNH/GDSL hydrolase family protein [Mucilaginibacter sp. dw_454]|uniref:SGNH/GDSL hydrolase family protein n=1 Tax=Mucilaginibacter sp. dw_454 TaxID=2720079 RepID=UPI001BD5FB5B|nr:SGNH/GDSL hydrolase family protein [Mucilaginibacter sp. dw_454]